MATELVDGMVGSGALIVSDGRLRAAAEHTSVSPETLRQPWPRDWPQG